METCLQICIRIIIIIIIFISIKKYKITLSLLFLINSIHFCIKAVFLVSRFNFIGNVLYNLKPTYIKH